MSVFHKVLVAYDGSPDSRVALELAISLARDQRATVTLLTVVPNVAAAVTSVAAGPYDLDSAFTELHQSAVATIPDDVSVTAILCRGNPAQCIADAATDHDLVVMGTHGRGRIGEALAGSVSRGVVHALRGAVLLTRAPQTAAAAADPA